MFKRPAEKHRFRHGNSKIKTKSVYSAIEPRRGGLRVLVTRFRGRGLSKSRYDVWMPNLGPSEQLPRHYPSGRLTWAEFNRRYRGELFEDRSIGKRNWTVTTTARSLRFVCSRYWPNVAR